MYSADEIYDTAELEDDQPSIPDHHFTDIDIDDIEGEDKDDDDGEDNEPSDDFGGSFPLSVEYDDLPEPTYIDADDWF